MEAKIIQITSGRGPAECCWVVAQVLKLMLVEAKSTGLEHMVILREKGPENGTLFSATVRLEGDGLNTFLQNWTGTVQWVGQSQFRKYHKRKNWFIGIDEVPLDAAFAWNEKDFAYQATRSGGPGGQHVNKVSTAVRATHLPTGTSVLASDSRSQQQNRKQARIRLIGLLEVKHQQKQREQVKDSWQNHNELQRGNPVRVFKGTDFKPKPLPKSNKAKRIQLKNDLRKQMNEP